MGKLFGYCVGMSVALMQQGWLGRCLVVNFFLHCMVVSFALLLWL